MTGGVVCASGVALLMDYLEGALSQDVRGSVESHVAGCARCRAFVHSYGETPGILRRATVPETFPDLEPFWRKGQ